MHSNSSIGPYQVEGELGRGGMGVVYRARDPRLDRTVAIKALPPELASDPARLDRFEREARTLAQLNHPNLVGIHGLEEHEGRKYLVLEFVEGETLADRLDRGPLPPDEAVEMAIQIAAGVEAAHEAGVIHRDLKPANIIVTPDGRAKVLDFGLARTDEGASSSSVLSAATLTSPVQHSPTVPGVILGTAAYMSPEQARGRRVDKRTDIWSFGVILYEMLTGASPFVGETVSDSIGAVLHKDVQLSSLPLSTPASVRRVLQRCLQRDKALRYRDVGDAALDLAAALHEPLHPDPSGRGGRPWRAARMTAGALVLVAAGVAIGWASLSPSTPAESGAAHPIVVDLAPPKGYLIARRSGPPRLSPDGVRLALIVAPRPTSPDGEVGAARLCIKSLSTGEVTVFDEFEQVSAPQWAPDGKSLTFHAGSAVYRYDEASGQFTRVLSSPSAWTWGSDWTSDGRYIACVNRDAISCWDLRTGQRLENLPVRTGDDSGGGFPVWPQMLPDGEHYIYTYTGSEEHGGVYLGTASDAAHTRLLTHDRMQTRYVPPRGELPAFLYYARDDVIFRQPLDLEARQLLGEPEHVASAAWGAQWPYFTPFDAGGDSTLVYFTAPVGDFENELVFVDLESGEERPSDLRGSLWNPMYSSDDRHLLLDITTDETNGDIFSLDLERGLLATRISGEPVNESFPIWVGKDNRNIAFFHDGDIFLADREGVQRPRPILEGPEVHYPLCATPDGRQVLVGELGDVGQESPVSIYDIERGEARPWLDVDIQDVRIARNGGWALVRTGPAGRRQLELRRYPEGTGRIVLDAGEIRQIEFAGDDSALFYLRDDMLARIALSWPEASAGDAPDRPGPDFSAPEEILEFVQYREYDVNSDGTEIAAIRSAEQFFGDSVRLSLPRDR